ncbi:hypothetical protein BKI52_32960 [marine bacterium AO1-C]|nr:hypothetical protein BKI52_32960 [marine bacterium AO1-C]
MEKKTKLVSLNPHSSHNSPLRNTRARPPSNSVEGPVFSNLLYVAAGMVALMRALQAFVAGDYSQAFIFDAQLSCFALLALPATLKLDKELKDDDKLLAQHKESTGMDSIATLLGAAIAPVNMTLASGCLFFAGMCHSFQRYRIFSARRKAQKISGEEGTAQERKERANSYYSKQAISFSHLGWLFYIALPSTEIGILEYASIIIIWVLYYRSKSTCNN